MTPDPEIIDFIGDSFSSVWDLELLSVLLAADNRALSAPELEAQIRGSHSLVAQGIHVLSSAGLIAVHEQGRVRFSPVDDATAALAREAVDFYRRFPGRVRRLLIARQAPGLSAFADAFRLRKDGE